MEREVGGGIEMGNTCKPMAVSFQCMTKSTTIKKKKRRTESSHVSLALCVCSDIFLYTLFFFVKIKLYFEC